MRFSESPIWTASRAYYRTTGTAAWTADGLPTRICTNAALAEAYASVIHHFLEEAAAGAPRAYVVELGAATGRFAHLVLAALEALRGALGGAAQAPR
jgi:SAM-dependent MidA family methyltransferase